MSSWTGTLTRVRVLDRPAPADNLDRPCSVALDDVVTYVFRTRGAVLRARAYRSVWRPCSGWQSGGALRMDARRRKQSFGDHGRADAKRVCRSGHGCARRPPATGARFVVRWGSVRRGARPEPRESPQAAWPSSLTQIGGAACSRPGSGRQRMCVSSRLIDSETAIVVDTLYRRGPELLSGP